MPRFGRTMAHKMEHKSNMTDRVVRSGLLSAISMLFVFSASAWDGYDATPVVQQIGEVTGETADAVFAEVRVVPFSRRRDARETPILLARGKAYLLESGKGPSGRKRVRGLSRPEKRAIKRAYRAGQTIMMLDASTQDVEVLHTLLRDGAPHESKTDPVVLAYALRQIDDLPTARVVTRPRPTSEIAGGGPEADERAWKRSMHIITDELTTPPLTFPEEENTGTPPDLSPNWAQMTTVTSTTNGIYNTQMWVYALHSCRDNRDWYLVDTLGDWTATDAKFHSASKTEGTLSDPSQGGDFSDLDINWQNNDDHCTGGIAVANQLAGGTDQRICRYVNYPTSYVVDILPPNGPTVIQDNATPSATQGTSTQSTTGFQWSIGTHVNISGDGPSAGLQLGMTWDNSTTVTVPALLTLASSPGNEGSSTEYQYCTKGSSSSDCKSEIQMTGSSGLCREYVVGNPQQGQKPSGRLSNVHQTVNWQVDPTTYGESSAFDVDVTFTANMASSISRLWWGNFGSRAFGHSFNGPSGYCNSAGCSCSISNSSSPITISHTFKIPFPSSAGCPQ